MLGEMACDLANAFRQPNKRLDTWQKVWGDNVEVVLGNYHNVLAVKLGYDFIGAKAN